MVGEEKQIWREGRWRKGATGELSLGLGSRFCVGARVWGRVVGDGDEMSYHFAGKARRRWLI